MKLDKNEYQEYLLQKSPDSPIWKDMLWAFVVGGIICTIGQGIFDFYKNVLSVEDEQARVCVSITLIFLGALLTGLDIYCKIGKYAGAGTIVPITGFANSIVSPALEFKGRSGFRSCLQDVCNSRTCSCLWNSGISGSWNYLLYSRIDRGLKFGQTAW